MDYGNSIERSHLGLKSVCIGADCLLCFNGTCPKIEIEGDRNRDDTNIDDTDTDRDTDIDTELLEG